MAKKLYEESNIEAIAEKIREKTGGTKTYTTAEMPNGVDEVYNKGYETGYETGTTSKVIDLTGTTWVLNATLSLSQFSYNINFNSNGNTYAQIRTAYNYNGQKYYYALYYYNANGSLNGVYGINGSDVWDESTYQTITITGGTDAINTDLIDWLYTNGIRGDVDYNMGYNDGYDKGYNTGYDIGYDAGVDITSDATATAYDIVSGATAYVNGEKVEGAIPIANSTINAHGIAPSQNGQFVETVTTLPSNQYVKSGTKISLNAPLDTFGNATASDVLSGKTFTSSEGFVVKGTSTAVETGDATATADYLVEGYSAYVNGKKIEGTIPYCSNSYVAYEQLASLTQARDTMTKTVDVVVARSSNSAFSAPRYCSGGDIIGMEIALSEFGDATAADVVAGKTFTSAEGLKVVGTNANAFSPASLVSGSYKLKSTLDFSMIPSEYYDYPHFVPICTIDGYSYMGFYIDNDYITAIEYPNGGTTTLYRDGGWVQDEYKTWSFGIGIVSPLLDRWLNANVDRTFTLSLGNITYVVDEGMTWAQWVNSSYNTGGYYVGGDNSIYSLDGEYYVIDNYESSVSGSDVVEADVYYDLYPVNE